MTITTATAEPSDASGTVEDITFLLATDLDGTFLAGDPDERVRLYQTLARHHDVRLAYVTGRGLESVLPLLADPTLPTPDYIIGDVGATVVTGDECLPVEPIHGRITGRWPGEQAITEAIGDRPGLVRQDVPQDRRVSYFCEPGVVDDALRRVVEDLGCDLLYSADRYLDVLPGGVNKGSTLTALINQLGLPPERVLVAGDTLNDLSMYGRGFAGVCVGQSEPALLDQTRELPTVLHADAGGCGGILEAIDHFGLLHDEHLRPGPRAEVGTADLVMVYHRLPYDEVVEDGELTRRRPRSPNGIIPTLLSFFADGREGSWVAWSEERPELGAFERHTTVDPQQFPKLTVARVALSKDDIDVFYKSFSKEAFWPLLHTFWERARFSEEQWQVFCQVNQRFAEAAAAESAHGATVWIHDYNLWMVPAYLRELRPDVRIAFLHHTHFPSADVFNVLPWRREIVGSLLQCDYVGFHVPRQVENFVDVVRGVAPVRVLETASCAPRFLTYGCAMGTEHMTTLLDGGDRRVHLGAHPVGVDIDRIEGLLDRDEAQELIRRTRAELGGQRLALSVARLDYTKGVLQQLQAFELLLERSPELHGELTLFSVCVPAAKEMTVYQELQTEIEQAVGRINGRFGRVGWTPVHYFFRPIPFEQLLAWYAVADIMWITPLRDGLNLIAKEYVAAQGHRGGEGVLVLSEFAGAAAELKGALLTNPHDVEDLVSVFDRACAMDPQEAKDRLRGLWDIVRRHDASAWADGFLGAVEAAE